MFALSGLFVCVCMCMSHPWVQTVLAEQAQQGLMEDLVYGEMGSRLMMKC